MALTFKNTIRMVLGKTSDYVDTLWDETESYTDSTPVRATSGEVYIDSTTSASIPKGNIGVVRHIWLKGNVKARLKLNGTLLAVPLRAGSNSAWHFLMRTSASTVSIINSTSASGRFEYRLAGT